MGNPASDLASLLESWTVPGTSTAEATRGDASAASPSFWDQHRRAVQAIADVEDTARSLIRDGVQAHFILQVLPEVYQAVFAVTTPWGTQSNGSRPALTPSTILLLRAFAALSQEFGVVVDATGLEAVQQGLESVESLLLAASNNEISRKTRIYLLRLVSEALEALKDPLHDGGRRAQTATNAVTGALTGQLVTLPRVEPSTQLEKKSLRENLVGELHKLVTAAVIAFGTTFGTHAGDVAWQLTESGLASVYQELSTEAEAAANDLLNPPALEAGKSRLELEPGTTQDSAEPTPDNADR